MKLKEIGWKIVDAVCTIIDFFLEVDGEMGGLLSLFIVIAAFALLSYKVMSFFFY